MGAGASSTSKGASAAPSNTASSTLSLPSAAQFASAISGAAQRKDDAHMRRIFNRHAKKEKLSASALIEALKDVSAPVLAAASSEGSLNTADYIFRRADANLSGDVDFSE
jgi:membrane-bound lytic murein transglycosylase B